MLKLYILASCAALIMATGATAQEQTQRQPRSTTTERLRTVCIGNRCAVYDRFGRRVGTVTRTSPNRYTVRDLEGRLQERITTQGSTVIVDPRLQ